MSGPTRHVLLVASGTACILLGAYPRDRRRRGCRATVRDMSKPLDRWKPALTNVGSAFVLGAVGWVVEGRLTVPVVMAIAFALGWGWWVSPLRRAQPHVDHADALAAAGRDGLIAYWRPGCSYCVRLCRALEPDERDRITWVNIMADAEGARYIRRFHAGDMVTPTVVAGAEQLVAPSAEQIRARLR